MAEKLNVDYNSNRFDSTPELGLNDEQVKFNKENNRINRISKNDNNTYLKIIIKNVCTLFNFIYLIIFLAIFFSTLYMKTHHPNGEYSTSVLRYTFLVVVIINLLIGTIQEIKSKQQINKLKLLSDPKVTVIRNGKEKLIKIADIVLDDIIKYTPGNQIITDSILVSGEIEVNESQLTGESDLIKKTVTTDNQLWSGTFIVSGNCFARVDKVGKDNKVEQITAAAKKLKKPNSEILNSLNIMIRAIAVFLVVSAFFMFLQSYDFREFAESSRPFSNKIYDSVYKGFLIKIFKHGNNDLYTTVNSTSSALIGMIPAGLLMMTSGALALGVIRLSKKNTLVKDIYCVETLARVNVLCLDKTGTITTGEMEVAGFENLTKKSDEEVDHFLHDMIGNLNAALHETNATAQALVSKYGDLETKKASDIIPFSSERKLSGAVFDDKAYVIGAPEFVMRDFKDYKEAISKKAKNGLRILCFAEGTFNKGEFKYSKPIALIYIKDKIRPDAKEILKKFKDSGVELKVISGDNEQTVKAIAKEVGITGECVNLTNVKSEEKLRELALTKSIFGRVKPEQKKIIVEALHAAKKTVAMTGDGVNDIPALKEADCSVVMASGSDAAKSIAQIVLIDSNFSSMPEVVNEGRRAINNVKKIASLFLMKTIFVLSLVILTITGFFRITSGDPAFPFSTTTQMLMLESFVIGIPSLFLTIQPNHEPLKGKFLKEVMKNSLPGAIAIIFAVMVTYGISKKAGFSIKTTKTIVVLTTTFIGLMVLYLACKPFVKVKNPEDDDKKEKVSVIIRTGPDEGKILDIKKAILYGLMVFICLVISGVAMTKPYLPFGLYRVSEFVSDSFMLDNLFDIQLTDSKVIEEHSDTIDDLRKYFQEYTSIYEEFSENLRFEIEDNLTLPINNEGYILYYLYRNANEGIESLNIEKSFHINTIRNKINNVNTVLKDKKTIFTYIENKTNQLQEYIDLNDPDYDIETAKSDIIVLNALNDYFLADSTLEQLIIYDNKISEMSDYLVYNYTGFFLTFSLVAFSFIIMSVSSYFIKIFEEGKNNVQRYIEQEESKNEGDEITISEEEDSFKKNSFIDLLKKSK